MKVLRVRVRHFLTQEKTADIFVIDLPALLLMFRKKFCLMSMRYNQIRKFLKSFVLKLSLLNKHPLK